MFMRVVTLNCIPGAEDELRRIGRDILVHVNKQAGGVSVYFLEPKIEDNTAFPCKKRPRLKRREVAL